MKYLWRGQLLKERATVQLTVYWFMFSNLIPKIIIPCSPGYIRI